MSNSGNAVMKYRANGSMEGSSRNIVVQDHDGRPEAIIRTQYFCGYLRAPLRAKAGAIAGNVGQRREGAIKGKFPKDSQAIINLVPLSLLYVARCCLRMERVMGIDPILHRYQVLEIPVVACPAARCVRFACE